MGRKAASYDPMFTSVKIRRFKSCKDVSITGLGEMAALAGRNGVGKTNMLKAIETASKAASSRSPEISTADVAADIVLDFTLNDREYSYEYILTPPSYIFNKNKSPTLNAASLSEKLSICTDKIFESIFVRVGEQIDLSSSKQTLRTGSLTAAAYAIQELLPNDPAVPIIKLVTAFLSKVKYYAFEETSSLQDISFLTKQQYEEWRLGKASKTSPDLIVLLKLLHLHLEDREKFDEFVSLIGVDGLNIINSIDIKDYDIGNPAKSDSGVHDSTKYYFFQFTPAHHAKDSDFDFTKLSFGTRRLVRLVLALLYDKSSVLLIEQPEDGIHSGLTKKLIPCLRSYAGEGQIFLTTHSSHVLNAFKPDEIRLAEMENGVTSVRALSPREAIAAHAYMDQEGSLAEFLQSVQGV